MKAVLHKIGPYIGLVLFGIALFYLNRELHRYNFHEIFQYFSQLPYYKILFAIVTTAASYAALTGYDTLGFRYVNRRDPYKKIKKPAFIGYAFSNSIGFSLITGGSLRYRMYSAWGLSGIEITKIVAFCGLTLWAGFLTLSSFSFLLTPRWIPTVLHLPVITVRIFGILASICILGYIAGGLFIKRKFVIGDWLIHFPGPGIILRQILLASFDWTMAAAALYILLPSSQINFFAFLSVFLLAQVAGIISQVPGGLGIFESIMILFLSSTLSAVLVLSALIAYRIIYYILPFIAGALLLANEEWKANREHLKRVSKQLTGWISGITPQVLAFVVFISGVILLLSGATPELASRLHWLKHFVPFFVIEWSHFLGGLAGIWLLILARGLQRRLDAAYHLALLLLLAGIVFSLLKGFDYEVAIILAIILMAMLPARSEFYRKASLFQQKYTPAWIAAILIIIISSIWLTLFSFHHAEYSHELWWKFALHAKAPRHLRVFVGVVPFAIIFGLLKLLKTSRIDSVPSQGAYMDRAKEIIHKSPQTEANLVLLGDKTLLFNDDKTTFLAYATEGNSWVVMGDPVGEESAVPDLLWKFWDLCDRHGAWPVFYQVREEYLGMYIDLGLTLLKLGEEARVKLEQFTMAGRKWKTRRYMVGKMQRDGYRFEIMSREEAQKNMDTFRNISDEWLKDKHTQEKGFSLGFFDEAYLGHFPFAVVKKENKIVAFANIWVGAGKQELSVDLMRHGNDAPGSIMDYIFIELMKWGKEQGYAWFNLGIAPLSGMPNQDLAPLWSKFATFIYKHGEYFYNFQGLRQYKDKFYPEWRPRYLACPGGLALPVVLTNVTTLISGGWKGVISK
jgi:phosphatidylglycerol lysyltransferase